ncbi:ATP-dependent DNA helicase [Halomonas sp. MCCC 1A17488]|uniref:ATP-dependent DNA helicase n=1 Tax=Billgrantia sulfidoxydans TaxID=2733484 RepID=A0ABX7WA09_9GAMM|nr:MULTISPECIES: ATP-dependent DNA helicase [Halomonas]MCE8018462.1 ATP-dependent DNA helicase [Halomonas sp. MCCC 1A17488]MCG3241795.1 ATP-dependent DNA helicase [Halomonas sp. MCCC 1A17488]QPP51709.1 ATP-dependent DNA helicase [Halomonas sp. SS10-MC5]QTP57198.1 ATP-dependent DNA helicase [Halomonas sulfidoxydans]
MAHAATPRYRVAVRALCDFTAREGDLDHRFTPSPSAREGIAGHALVTGRREEGYEREIVLSGCHRGLLVSGRADGYDPRHNRLEEIKTHRGDLSRMAANQRALHWAQVRVYGALLCAERGLDSLTLALVYLDIGSERETLLTETASAADLTAFFEAQCERFLGWAEQEAQHRQARDTALADLDFPHAEFRPGQRELAEGVYKAAATGRCLLAEAPTGIGKTVATLFPTLKAMPRQGIDRLAFLTMKTPGRRLALDALARLGTAGQGGGGAGDRQRHLPLRVLELTARSKVCEHPDKACHGDACPLAAGFYDRLPSARQAAVARGWLDREALRQVAREHGICPYYLGQELARWSDVCVGDVNHYFDASALLYGLAQANGWRLALLVDEAHNLVERARGMYSGELHQRAFGQLHRSAPAPLVKPLGRLMRQWQALVREQGGADEGQAGQPTYRVLDDLPARFVGALQQAAAAITDYLAEHPGGADPLLQERLFEALGFCRLAESFGEHSLCDLTRHGRGRAVLGLRNLIPADFLAPRFAQAHSSVLFSATLSPVAYHRDLLGVPGQSVRLSVASPFRAEQLEVRIQGAISTRLRDREASLDPIVDELAGQYRRRPGLYLAFFSSFAYLQAVEARLARRHPELPCWSQSRGMREAERDAFLARFQPGAQGIGFAVLGGAFGEGIDLPGERLIGAFIATLGLPPFDPFNEALKARLESRFGCGDAYAYRIPGLIKVIQAAGRVIRSPQDRGTLVLMDDRFQRHEVRQLLPEWWRTA